MMMAELWQENNRSHSLPDRIRRALGNVEAQGGSSAQVRVIQEEQAFTVEHPMELLLEDGTHMTLRRQLPTDLLCGYHTLRHPDGGVSRLIVAPSRCFFTGRVPYMGLVDTVVWFPQSSELGYRRPGRSQDAHELDRPARGRRDSRESFEGRLAVGPQQRSPYSPMTRLFGNLLYVHPEHIEGAQAAGLEQDRLIDRDTVLTLKMEALSYLWAGSLDE